MGGLKNVISGGFQAAGAISEATSTGSISERTSKGALTGASAGAAFGPFGAAAGAAIGGLVGFFGGRKAAQQMKEAGKFLGMQVSEGLAEQIQKSAKDLDIGTFEAAMLNLGGAIREDGGLSEENLTTVTKNFNDLLNAVANGSIPAAAGMEGITDALNEMLAGLSQMGEEGAAEILKLVDRMGELGQLTDDNVNSAFQALQESVKDMGVAGAFQIGEMVTKMEELGKVTKEMASFIKEQATNAVGSLTKFFDILSNQAVITSEEATAAIAQITAAFEAAMKATGSLVGAIRLLGPSFEEVIERLRGVLGEENAVLNTMTEYYQFVQANEGTLGAIDALTSSMSFLAAAGLLNKTNIEAFGESAILNFEKILAATDNELLALAAIAPGVAAAVAAYIAAGVEVPPALQLIFDKAEAAGHSMEIPQSTHDMMSDIRDIMILMAIAIGVSADEMERFNRATNSAGPPDTPTGTGTGSGDTSTEGIASGGLVRGNPPHGTLFRIGENEDEWVIPVSQMGRGKKIGAGTSTSSNVTMNIPVTVHTAGVVQTESDLAIAIAPAVTKAVQAGWGELREEFQSMIDDE